MRVGDTDMNKIGLYLACLWLRFVVWRVTRNKDNQHVLMFEYQLNTDEVTRNPVAWYGTGAVLKEHIDTLIAAVRRCVRASLRANKLDLSPEALFCNNWKVSGTIYLRPYRVEISSTMRRSNGRAYEGSPSHVIEL